MYSKRPGMSGIAGALYETKLLCLLYFRAIHDDDIEEFQLASQIDKVGVFDDICLKAKVKGCSKPFAVFIQARLRYNQRHTLNIDFATYFNSYMKVRQLFHPRNKDLYFRGTFDETECLFVIYTNAKIDFSDDSVGSGFFAKLKYLIGTGGTIKEPYKYENITEYLTKIAVTDQVTSLAERIAKFITGKEDFQIMLTDEQVLRYHVILGQKVFNVSEIKPDGYRMASFRNEFFDTNEEYIIIFKDTLFKEILKKRTINPADIRLFLSEFLDDPTDAIRLSKLIGTVVTYNYGQLEFDKRYIKDFSPHKRPMDVSRSTVTKAVELAAKEILLCMHFKVPAAFGNKDLTLRCRDAKIELRINYLALRICDLLDNCKSSNRVTIEDEPTKVGFLQLNGVIASAIGNIFVLDDNSKLLKITDDWESLGTLAKRLYLKLNSEIHNLHDYKFCFKVDMFPKLSFGDYEENLVRDFLNRLQFYCNQADEKGVEEILKAEIDDYQHNQPNYFQVKTDAIFSKYHAVMQEWWTQPYMNRSLTRESDLFEHSINNIIKDPLMSSINVTYMNKLQQYNYTFTEDAVKSLNLQDQDSSTVIVAENSVLTVVKVMQHLKKKGKFNQDLTNHVVLDLEYIANLPMNDQNALRSELINMKKVLILVCDKIDSRNEMKTLEDIAEAVRRKTTIIITNQTTIEVLHKYFPKPDAILHDKKLSLIDMSKESQENIFETATAILPGVEIRLDLFLRGWPKTGPRSAGTAVVESAVADKETGTSSR